MTTNSDPIVYLDEHLLVVNKPPGVSLITRKAHPGDAVERLIQALTLDEPTLSSLDMRQLRLVHRLDEGTSGLLMIARDEATHRLLVVAISQRRIEKRYLALVWGHPRPKEGRYNWSLSPDRKDRRRMRADTGGSSAVTCYRTVSEAPHVSLLELRPETGRTHQIRVHLACAGHWIVGDDLYGGPRYRGIRNMEHRQVLKPPPPLLHAWKLILPEDRRFPVTHFSAPLPEHFSATLERLGIADCGLQIAD